jgi:hypothetical protein
MTFVTLLLAYLELICCEQRSFIDALEEKDFKKQFPVELQRQWILARTKNLNIIKLIINLCA